MQKRFLLPSFVIAVLFCVLLLFLSYTPVGSGFQTITTVLFSPVEMFFLHANQQIISSRSPLQKLEDENAALKQQIAQLQEIKNENQALHDQFLVTYPSSVALLPAKIISMPGFFPGVSAPSVLLIDKGSVNGVKLGTGVVVEGNLIGIISQVAAHTADVQLISQNGFSFTAKDVTTNALGIIRGQGNQSILFDNVVLSDKLNIGDFIMTKGDQVLSGEGIPQGLIVGQVSAVDRFASNLFQRAKITSLVEVEKLTEVFLLQNRP